VGDEVDAAEGELGVDLDLVFVSAVLLKLEQDLEAGHGVLDGALLHGDLQLGLPCPGPDDEAEGVGELLDLLVYEVLGL
jgi:hypothetical protein